MRANKLFPRRGRLPFWRWRDAMPFQNVAYRLVTDGVSQIR
jgi:hypothetical protein